MFLDPAKMSQLGIILLVTIVSVAYSAPTSTDIGNDTTASMSILILPTPSHLNTSSINNATNEQQPRQQPVESLVKPSDVALDTKSNNNSITPISGATINTTKTIPRDERKISKNQDQNNLISVQEKALGSAAVLVDRKPIVAVLPAGTNLTTVWDSSSNTKSTIAVVNVTPSLARLSTEGTNTATVSATLPVSSTTDERIPPLTPVSTITETTTSNVTLSPSGALLGFGTGKIVTLWETFPAKVTTTPPQRNTSVVVPLLLNAREIGINPVDLVPVAIVPAESTSIAPALETSQIPLTTTSTLSEPTTNSVETTKAVSVPVAAPVVVPTVLVTPSVFQSNDETFSVSPATTTSETAASPTRAGPVVAVLPALFGTLAPRPTETSPVGPVTTTEATTPLIVTTVAVSTEEITNVSHLQRPVTIPANLLLVGNNTFQQSVARVIVHGITEAAPVTVITPAVLPNQRVDVLLLDCQVNSTAGARLNQRISVYAKLTGEALPPLQQERENASLLFLTPDSGFRNVFDGIYLTRMSNKIPITRMISQDFCDQNVEKAYLEVLVTPVSIDLTSPESFPQQYFVCVLNTDFLMATRVSGERWSDIQYCNSENGNGYSNRLWFQVRQYKINSADCQKKQV